LTDQHAGFGVVDHAEQSRAEQSRAEQSRAEQSRAEQSRAEQSRAQVVQSIVQASGAANKQTSLQLERMPCELCAGGWCSQQEDGLKLIRTPDELCATRVSQ